MKRLAAPALALLLALATPAVVCSQSRAALDKVMDLSVTIKSLSLQLEEGNDKAPAAFVILNGSLQGVLETDETGATVIIELVSGEWLGLEDVRSYHCLVRLQGEEYLAAFPASPPRDAGPEVFAKSTRMLVVAYPVGVADLTDGRSMWLLEGVYVRRL